MSHLTNFIGDWVLINVIIFYLCIMKTAILLATYNGVKYLREQVESLYRQTYTEWTLYVSDDGSTDGTIELLAEYERTKKNFVVLRRREGEKERGTGDSIKQRKGGAKENFLWLLEQVDADYYFFCDQDDIWREDKMAVEMERMLKEQNVQSPIVGEASAIQAQLKTAESQHESTKFKPMVVFSDLYVTDAQMNVMCESFHHYSGIRPQLINSFNEAGGVNHVTGCTMLINRMAKACVKLPATAAAMHDSWVTLCVLKAGGTLAYVQQPLVYYRQHGGNTLGASDFSRLSLAWRAKNYNATVRQLCERYRMLKALDYGPWIKFIYYRMLYKWRRKKLIVDKLTN